MNEAVLQVIDNDFVLIIKLLFQLVLLAMALERGFYFLFKWKFWHDFLKEKKLRVPIVLSAAWYLCYLYDFDLVSMIINSSDGSTHIGIVTTACIVAWGSKSAAVLFQDELQFSKESRKRFLNK